MWHVCENSHKPSSQKCLQPAKDQPALGHLLLRHCQYSPIYFIEEFTDITFWFGSVFRVQDFVNSLIVLLMDNCGLDYFLALLSIYVYREYFFIFFYSVCPHCYPAIWVKNKAEDENDNHWLKNVPFKCMDLKMVAINPPAFILRLLQIANPVCIQLSLLAQIKVLFLFRQPKPQTSSPPTHAVSSGSHS